MTNRTLLRAWREQAIREYEEARVSVRLTYPREDYVRNYVNYMRERWEKFKRKKEVENGRPVDTD